MNTFKIILMLVLLYIETQANTINTIDTVTVSNKFATEGGFAKINPAWKVDNTGKIITSSGIIVKYDHIQMRKLNKYKNNFNTYGGFMIEYKKHDNCYISGRVILRTIDSLIVPSIKITNNNNIFVGDTIEIKLTGTPSLMTSWQPILSITGVNFDFISFNNFIYKYKIKTKGNMKIKLKHNGILINHWQETFINKYVKEKQTIPNSINNLKIELTNDNRPKLTWNDSQENIYYNIYRRQNDGTYEEAIKTKVYNNFFYDSPSLINGKYFWTITAVNDIGESEKSNEVSLNITSINDTKNNGNIIFSKNIININNPYIYNNFKIIDINGKIWKEIKPISNEISVQNLPTGAYFLLMEGPTPKKFKFIKN